MNQQYWIFEKKTSRFMENLWPCWFFGFTTTVECDAGCLVVVVAVLLGVSLVVIGVKNGERRGGCIVHFGILLLFCWLLLP